MARDLDKIVQMYNSGMTARDIAPHFGVSFRTILRDLNKSGVKMRNAGAERIKELEDAEWLKAQYKSGKSTTDIGKLIGCSARTVYTWLVRYGVEMRSVGSQKGHKRFTVEAREKLSKAKRGSYLGKDNPNWKGGHTPNPERNRYPAKMWSKQVRERDNHTCVECGATERLHAHHIKRWKDYPELRYDLENGVTLCYQCHEKAHGKGFKFRFSHHAKSDTSASPLNKG